MANLQTLNNIDHKDLNIITELSAEFGDSVGGALIFPAELIAVQREYPIVFQKEPQSGQLQMVALFGFQGNENLFLSGKGWAGRYIPALMRKDPFFIGFQKDPQNAMEQQMVIHVNVDSPRLTKDKTKGKQLFLEGGGFSPILHEIKKNLISIHNGIAEAKILTDVLLEHNLLEQFTLDAKFSDGTNIQTNAYYTVNTDELYKLSSEVLSELHKKGYLQLIYLIHFSFGNFQNLVDRKNGCLKQGV
jgi:hypothetical protein